MHRNINADQALEIMNALSGRSDLQRAFMSDILGGNMPASSRPRNRTGGTTTARSASQGSNNMATTTQTAKQKAAAAAAAKKRAAKGAAKPKPTAKPKATSSTETKAEAGAKTAARKERDAALTKQILEMRENDSKWAEIASELNITSGKAQYLIMLHEVAEGTVPAITWRNDTEKVARIKKAREANDEYSSWGWLSARTGISEGTLKTFMSEHMDVKGTNVAVARSATATNGEAKIGKAAAKKPAAKSAAVKAKAAKAAAKRPS